jgi:hypothetical protein
MGQVASERASKRWRFAGVEEGNTAAWARTRVDGFGARGGRGPGAAPSLYSRVLCGGPRMATYACATWRTSACVYGPRVVQ